MGHRQSKPTYENEQSPVPAPVPEDRCDQLEYELYRSREEVKIINETYQQIKKKMIRLQIENSSLQKSLQEMGEKCKRLEIMYLEYQEKINYLENSKYLNNINH